MDETALALGRVIMVMSGCLGVTGLGLSMAYLVSFINPSKGWRWKIGAQLAVLNLSPEQVRELYHRVVARYNLTEEEQELMFKIMKDVVKEHTREMSREKFINGIN